MLVAGLVLTCATYVAYSNSFSVPFLYDDSTAVVANSSLHHLWPISSVLSPPARQTTSGRPLVNLALALNYAFGGLDVLGYHVVNLAIHVFASLVLMGIVRRTLELPRFSSLFGKNAEALAFCIASLWALHPLQTESVTYVVQRAESLMGLFYFLALYSFIRSCQRIETKRSGYWEWASVLFCFAGMATKEVMASAPLAILFYDRTFISQSWKSLWGQRSRFYLGLVVSWLLLVACVVSTGGTRDGSAGFSGAVGPWAYALNSAVAIVHYLKLSLWPRPLVFDYGNTVIGDLSQIIPSGLIIVLLGFAVVVTIRRAPAVAFAGFCFFRTPCPDIEYRAHIVTEP